MVGLVIHFHLKEVLKMRKSLSVIKVLKIMKTIICLEEPLLNPQNNRKILEITK